MVVIYLVLRMFHSVSEYLSCCKETFSLFREAEEIFLLQTTRKEKLLSADVVYPTNVLERQNENFELSPFGVRCAFEVITGYSYRHRDGENENKISGELTSCPLVAMNESTFIDWMKSYSEVDKGLVSSSIVELSRSPNEEMGFTAEMLLLGSSISAWEMFESIAGSNGFISLEDLQAAEDSQLFSELNVSKIVKESQCLSSFSSPHNIASDYVNKESNHRNGLATHLFHCLDSRGAERISFSVIKPFLTFRTLRKEK